MTIKKAILEKLAEGQATMEDIDGYVLYHHELPGYARESIRARVYELLKAGKVRRIRKGIYALGWRGPSATTRPVNTTILYE